MLGFLFSFGMPDWLKKLLPYILAALVALGGLWFVDHRAYQRGYATAESAQISAAAAEASRIAEANKRAIQDALRTIDRLTEEKEQRDAQIADLLREGAADSGSGNVSLPPGSVRRIQTIH